MHGTVWPPQACRGSLHGFLQLWTWECSRLRSSSAWALGCRNDWRLPMYPSVPAGDSLISMACGSWRP